MLIHPANHPIAVTSDADCDGLSISYHDCEHEDNDEISYDIDCYITRDEFENNILPYLDDEEEEECEGHESLHGEDMGATVYCDGSCKRRRVSWAKTYWRETGYASDHRGVVNCEVSTPSFSYPRFKTAVSV
jgi:hypothetical protein